MVGSLGKKLAMIIAIKVVIGALVGVEGKVSRRHEVNTIHDFCKTFFVPELEKTKSLIFLLSEIYK